jgi:hypothetical protein
MNISLPNKQQLTHLVDRALVAFVIAGAVVLRSTTDPTSKAAWISAATAGAVAVWQLIVSSLTNL